MGKQVDSGQLYGCDCLPLKLLTNTAVKKKKKKGNIQKGENLILKIHISPKKICKWPNEHI